MAELRLREDSILDGIRLIDLQKKYHTWVLICAVRRENRRLSLTATLFSTGATKSA